MKAITLLVLEVMLALLPSCHCKELNRTIRVNSEVCNSLQCAVGGVCCDIQRALDIAEDQVEIIVETDTNLNRFVEVCTRTGLHIHGSYDLEPFQVCCSKETSTGIGFLQVADLIMSNLIITDCGGVTNFSSCSQGLQTSQQAAMYFQESSNITMSAMTIANTNGSGVFMTQPSGKIVFHQTNFSHNLPNKQKESSWPWFGGGMTVLMNETSTSLYITECIFTKNQVVGITADKEKVYQEVDEGHGGGLFVQINCSGCQAIISRTNFTRNTAPYGGGASIILHESISDTTVEIADCYIVHNSAKDSMMSNGGGVQLGFSVGTTGCNNTVLMEKVEFSNNNALFGGGLSIFSTGLSAESLNSIELVNCTWKSNSASSGAAVDLTVKFHESQKGTLFIKPNFTDCVFQSNLIKLLEYQSLVGSGAFFSMSLDVIFEGNILFSANKGSAITAVDSVLHFSTTSAVFKKNVGLNGGAISLLSFAYINLSQGSTLKFISNKANGDGGAIYSRVIADHQLLTSSACAIQYDGPQYMSPNDWNTQIIFDNNLSQNGKKMNSIYVSSLQPCQIAYSNKKHWIVKKDSVFSFYPFKFSSGDWKEETATAASSFTSSKLTIPMSPGVTKELNITLYDDLNRVMNNTVLEVYLPSKKKGVDIVGNEVFVTDKKLALNGTVGHKTDITLQSVSLPKVNIEVHVTFTTCPPAYIYDHDSLACYCTKDAYFGISDCIQTSSSASSKILPGVWAGYMYNDTTESSYFVTSPCLFGMCDLGDKVEEALQIATVNSNNSYSVYASMICAKNRTGLLCSSCENGTSVYYHSDIYPCQDSTACHLGWLYFILSDLIPLTLVFVVITVSGTKITGGWIQGFILFSHLVQTISITANGIVHGPQTMSSSSLIFWGATYGLMNMKFLYVPELSFCLFENASTISMVAMRYVVTAYAMMLVFLVSAFVKYCIPRYRCLSRCVRYTSAKTSIVNGLSALLVLSFANCMETSFQILHSTHIFGENLISVATKATFMENVPYLKGYHLLFAIPAIVITVLMLIPATLLLLFPIFNNVITVLGIEKLRAIHIVSGIFGYIQLKPFYDLFYHSFKDEYRSFAGLYLFYRLFIQLPFFMQTAVHSYYMIELVLIIFLAVHAVIHPYANPHHNRIDAILFSILAVVNGMTCFNLTVVYFMRDKQNWLDLEILFNLQIVLISLPMITAIAYVTTAYILVPGYKRIRGRKNHHHDFSSEYGSMSIRQGLSLQESFSLRY